MVVGAMGTLTKTFEEMELDLTFERLQKTCLLGTARILRKVMNTS